MRTFADSALTSLGSGLVTGGLDMLFSNLLAPINQSYARSQMRYQNELAKDLYDYEIMREQQAMSASSLRSRGLNPALVYGQGAGTQTSAAIGNSSLAPVASLEATPDFRAVSDVELSSSNVDKNISDIKSSDYYNALVLAQTKGQLLSNDAQKFINEINNLTRDSKVDEILARGRKAVAETYHMGFDENGEYNPDNDQVLRNLVLVNFDLAKTVALKDAEAKLKITLNKQELLAYEQALKLNEIFLKEHSLYMDNFDQISENYRAELAANYAEFLLRKGNAEFFNSDTQRVLNYVLPQVSQPLGRLFQNLSKTQLSSRGGWYSTNWKY